MRGDTDTVTLRFLLLSKHAGGIIGKGGETIKRLRSEFSAIVYVPDGISNERVLSIGADRENSVNVFRECLPLMHEPPYPVSSGGEGRGPSTIEVDFLVHSSQVGGIIGKAGARIKQIRDETNANIKVYPNCLPNCKERVVAIGGEEEEVVNALQQILDVMHEQPIKGEVTLYDPSYDGPYEEEYLDNSFNGPPGRGGMGGGMRGGGSGPMRGGMGGMGPGGPPPGGNYGPQGGYGGPGGPGGFPQQNYGANYGNQGAPQGGPQGYGGAGGAGGNFNAGGATGNMGGGMGGGGAPTTSTQVTIPNDMAGAIIGQGGRRIQEIRQKCGATIKFADPEPGKKDRLITISGSDEQIQYAQYLMQQCVIQNHT